jgi:hypothetical protein
MIVVFQSPLYLNKLVGIAECEIETAGTRTNHDLRGTAIQHEASKLIQGASRPSHQLQPPGSLNP